MKIWNLLPGVKAMEQSKNHQFSNQISSVDFFLTESYNAWEYIFFKEAFHDLTLTPISQ